MAKAKKKIRIVERKLGREKAAGQWWEESNLIEIDPRQNPKSYFNSCIHELAHHALPNLSEREICLVAGIIANGLWGLGYRKVMM